MKLNKKFSFVAFLLVVMISMLTGCQIVGDIFKAGVWVGILIVVGIIGILLWIVGRSKK